MLSARRLGFGLLSGMYFFVVASGHWLEWRIAFLSGLRFSSGGPFRYFPDIAIFN